MIHQEHHGVLAQHHTTELERQARLYRLAREARTTHDTLRRDARRWSLTQFLNRLLRRRPSPARLHLIRDVAPLASPYPTVGAAGRGRP